MIVRNMHQAKTHLSELVKRALNGEDVVIARAGKPVVKLVPVQKASPKRQFGLDAGQGYIADDFDAPLPPEIQQHFG